MMDVRERAKARTKKENQRKDKEARNQIVPIREDGTPLARQKIGTPLGNKQRMQEFKNKLLTEENGNKILHKVLEVAMDDEHPGQSAALKMAFDRLLPMSMFEESKNSSDRPTINISITGIGDAKVDSGNVIEHDDVE
jgi:hypothetical protein